MNIRQAILKAADSIEQMPRSYDFWSGYVHGCGTPMCMFGWIGHHLGMEHGTTNWRVAETIGLASTGDLYRWTRDRGFDHGYPKGAANGLRAFADARFPAAKHIELPTSVRAIFDMTPEQFGREMDKA